MFISGENHRNPPGNHKRQEYCFRSIFKIIGHWDAILHFGQRKMETNFFLFLIYQNYKIKSEIAFNIHIARMLSILTQ